MTMSEWFGFVIDGLKGSSETRRRSVWQRTAIAKEIQGLESRQLLSNSQPDSPENLPISDPESTSSAGPQGLVQVIASDIQAITSRYPQVPGLATQSFVSPNEDLYDEGAGAVWGTIADAGVYGNADCFVVYNDGDQGHMTGAGAVWGTIADEGVYGGVDRVADYGGNTTGAVAAAGGYGGVDDVVVDGDWSNANGAGAVWGTIADAGGYGGVDRVADYGGNTTGAVAAVGGYGGVDDVVADWGDANGTGVVWGTVADDGIYGGIDDIADYGVNTTGAIAAVGDYGGVDDADYGVNTTGAVAAVGDYGAAGDAAVDGGNNNGTGAVWGDVADDGIYGGVDDVADYGVNTTGAVAGIGDYGAVGDVADSGGNTTGSVAAVGDYGAVYGAADYGVDGDIGVAAAGGDYGTVTGGGPETTVTIRTIDAEAWEGPYRLRRLDEAKFSIDKDLLGTETTAIFSLSGSATYGTDYILFSERDDLPSMMLASDADGRFHVTIPANESSMTLIVRAVYDGDFEEPESVTVTLNSATPQARLGETKKADATIIDKTADLDISTVSQTEAMNEFTEDTPGANIRLNDDFDAGFPATDMMHYTDGMQGPFPDTENDLVPLTVKSFIDSENSGISPYAQQSQSLRYDPLQVRVWAYVNSATAKLQLIENGESIGGYTEFRVEGIGTGSGTIELVWNVGAPHNITQLLDTVKYTVWNVDLDIDSDNTRILQPPARSAWEEELEANKYGIGKLIFPTPISDGTEYDDGQAFTPLVVEISPAGESTSRRGLVLDFPGLSGQTGGIRIFTVPSNVIGGVDLRPFESGGHQITPGRFYSYDELSPARFYGFWIQGEMAQRIYDTKQGVNLSKTGNDNDYIQLTAFAKMQENDGWLEIETDRVKYKVVTPDSFYPNLQWRLHATSGHVLRDALAAEAIYYPKSDYPQFALQKLTGNDMRKLNIDRSIVDLVENSWADAHTGLQVAIYRDYASADGKGYILAFAGTEFSEGLAAGSDVIADLLQGMGKEGDGQYYRAMLIGQEIFDKLKVELELNPRITGHSLGGGLASAAYVVTGFPTNTFNSAGLHPKTLREQEFEGSTQKFLNALHDAGANDSDPITAWYMEFDVLSFIQDNMPVLPKTGKIPQAIGHRVMLKGPYDPILAVQASRLANLLKYVVVPELPPWDNTGVEWVDWYLSWPYWSEYLGRLYGSDVKPLMMGLLPKLGTNHTTAWYHYGLMVESEQDHSRKVNWNILGDLDTYGTHEQ